MDQDIEIIDKITRYEKIKNFVLQNKKKLIFICAIVLFTIFGLFLKQEIEKKNKIKIANRYNDALIEFNLGKKDLVILELKKIIEEKDSGYSPLALYFLIDNKLITSNEEINNFFDLIINDTKLDKDMKNLLIYKKALFNSEYTSENNLLTILNPLINSESIWKSHALYLMAEYFYSKGEKQKSREFYLQIIGLKNSDQNIKIEAQKRINRDYSD
tara:strand:+ start:1549 stop:2193 length:645 start_codon:yes stop_codon:yes gene_type:complete